MLFKNELIHYVENNKFSWMQGNVLQEIMNKIFQNISFQDNKNGFSVN